MPEIIVETIINASKETIWAQLTDLSKYSQLSKYIEHASGKLEKGSLLKVRLNIKGARIPLAVWVHDVEKDQKFSWGGPSSKWISTFFYASHFFVIEELGPDHCKFIHGEQIKGLFSVGSGVVLNRLKPVYSGINQALKERCEKVAA